MAWAWVGRDATGHNNNNVIFTFYLQCAALLFPKFLFPSQGTLRLGPRPLPHLPDFPLLLPPTCPHRPRVQPHGMLVLVVTLKRSSSSYGVPANVLSFTVETVTGSWCLEGGLGAVRLGGEHSWPLLPPEGTSLHQLEAHSRTWLPELSETDSVCQFFRCGQLVRRCGCVEQALGSQRTPLPRVSHLSGPSELDEIEVLLSGRSWEHILVPLPQSLRGPSFLLWSQQLVSPSLCSSDPLL